MPTHHITAKNQCRPNCPPLVGVQYATPPLSHFDPLFPVLTPIIGATNVVSLHMRDGPFHRIRMPEPALIGQCGEGGAESVGGMGETGWKLPCSTWTGQQQRLSRRSDEAKGFVVIARRSCCRAYVRPAGKMPRAGKRLGNNNFFRRSMAAYRFNQAAGKRCCHSSKIT